MDRSAVRHFAVTARKMLIRAVTQRAFAYSVTQNGEAASVPDCTPAEAHQRRQLTEHIRRKGFSQTMEEAAYIWFNRFTALRYMEVNGFLPSRIRVFSDADGAFRPEILTEAMHLDADGIDRMYILELLETQDNDTLYKYLLLSQCRALHHCLPGIFSEIGGWTELLFPDGLLRPDSVISHMVSDIPEADWRDQVQIIGWLYQYYNSELKDQVFADLKRNIKIPSASLPAATQLFTPDWIVRYMVENSLGRLWAEGHGKPAHAEWKYYLAEAEQAETVRTELEEIRKEYRSISPESLKIIDPCMGSGHVLVYAFDLLMDIYTACGWAERDAALSILRHNLYGLDIDRRAYQLSCFALMMKARQYNRNVLKNGEVQPNLANFADAAEMLEHAETCGSLLEVSGRLLPDAGMNEPQNTMLRRIVHMLTQRYDAVVTNPPYMGTAGMNQELSSYVRKHYPDSKSDLFACFMERGLQLVKPGGFSCMVTMQSWMFLSSFETMRRKLMQNHTLTSLMHMDNKVMGIAFGTAVSCFRYTAVPGYRCLYHHIRLEDLKNDEPQTFPPAGNRAAAIAADRFSAVPGMPAVYWISEQLIEAFRRGEPLGQYGDTRQGMATSDNGRFLRLWYEVSFPKLGFGCPDAQSAQRSGRKWFPYNKGGTFRKWFGNAAYVLNYEDDGQAVKAYAASLYGTVSRSVKSSGRYFQSCISWSKVSSGSIAFRYYPCGFVFDVAGCCIFYQEQAKMLYDFGLLNTKVTRHILEAFSPTLNYETGQIAQIPVIRREEAEAAVCRLAEENVRLAKEDWNAFETAWEFAQHPLVWCGGALTSDPSEAAAPFQQPQCPSATPSGHC